MHLAQVEGFLEVARLGSVSRAAQALGITQPALTVRVQALEEEIGARLFIRTARGVRLTDAGHTFLPYATQAVTALASGRSLVEDLRSGVSGELVLAAAPAVSTYVLPHVLVRFAERFPGVRLVVRSGHSEEIVDLILRDEVHVGLVRLIRQPQIATSPLYDDELVLVSAPGHPLSGRDAITREQLGDAPLILFDRSSSYYDLTTALVREAGVRPRGVMELDNIDAAKKMAEAGLGVALLPRTAVAQEFSRGTLWISRIAGSEPARRRIVVARRADAAPPTPPLAAFLEVLAQIPRIVPGALAPQPDDL